MVHGGVLLIPALVVAALCPRTSRVSIPPLALAITGRAGEKRPWALLVVIVGVAAVVLGALGREAYAGQ